MMSNKLKSIKSIAIRMYRGDIHKLMLRPLLVGI